jgi:hypothetical protein
MNTKDVLLVGAGVVVGYLLVGYMDKAKSSSQATKDAQTLADDKAKQAKIDSCNKVVADYMAMTRFAQGADLEALKKTKFDACMSAK